MEKRVNKQKSIVLYGFKITHNHIEPTIERCQGIYNFSEPRTRKELQRFLGAMN